MARDPSEAGETLMEVLIAATLMAIVVAVILGGMGTSLASSTLHREEANANFMLVSAMERLKSTDVPRVPCATAQTASYQNAVADPHTVIASTTAGSAEVTSASWTPSDVGMYIQGAGFPPTAAVLSVDTSTSPSTAIVSTNAASSGSATLTIAATVIINNTPTYGVMIRNPQQTQPIVYESVTGATGVPGVSFGPTCNDNGSSGLTLQRIDLQFISPDGKVNPTGWPGSPGTLSFVKGENS
jgi:type II secretory pathway pseudopilin PulG